jgi:DNA-3-methyladenine glycosylase (3mg)
VDVLGTSLGAVKELLVSDAPVTRAFFERDPLTCARDLLGCELIWRDTSGIIVETEAYAEYGDEASHSFLRHAVRTFIGERPAGSIYIYLNYGVYWLLNFLVKGKSFRGFVLIRALEPRAGIKLMFERRAVQKVTDLCSGPGKLTQAMGITAKWNGADFFAIPGVNLSPWKQPPTVIASQRIGITKSAELEWRYFVSNSPFVSGRKGKTRPRKN